MGYEKFSSHAVYDIEYHIVWTTKYRYKVLTGKVAERLRNLLRQGCEARGIKIIRGSVGKDHVHMLVSCPPTMAPCKIVQYLKCRSSKMLQEEFSELEHDTFSVLQYRNDLWSSEGFSGFSLTATFSR